MLKYYSTSEAAQADLDDLRSCCPESYQLKAKAYKRMAAEMTQEAEEKDSRPKEMLAHKYELLASIAEHQGMHKFLVLLDLKTDKLLDIGPILVPNGYSGKLEERWSVQHLREDRWHVPYAAKRPGTLSRYGYREAWVLLPASVGTQNMDKTKHFSVSSLHIFKIKDEVLPTLGLPDLVIDRYRHRFGTVFNEREQEQVFRHYLDDAEQLMALSAPTPTPVERQRSTVPALDWARP